MRAVFSRGPVEFDEKFVRKLTVGTAFERKLSFNGHFSGRARYLTRDGAIVIIDNVLERMTGRGRFDRLLIAKYVVEIDATVDFGQAHILEVYTVFAFPLRAARGLAFVYPHKILGLFALMFVRYGKATIVRAGDGQRIRIKLNLTTGRGLAASVDFRQHAPLNKLIALCLLRFVVGLVADLVARPESNQSVRAGGREQIRRLADAKHGTRGQIGRGRIGAHNVDALWKRQILLTHACARYAQSVFVL